MRNSVLRPAWQALGRPLATSRHLVQVAFLLEVANRLCPKSHGPLCPPSSQLYPLERPHTAVPRSLSQVLARSTSATCL